MKEWSADLDLMTVEVVPTRVTFPGLPLKYLRKMSLNKLPF